jgi:hypothetical protein
MREEPPGEVGECNTIKDDLRVCIEAAVAPHERPMQLELASMGYCFLKPYRGSRSRSHSRRIEPGSAIEGHAAPSSTASTAQYRPSPPPNAAVQRAVEHVCNCFETGMHQQEAEWAGDWRAGRSRVTLTSELLPSAPERHE